MTADIVYDCEPAEWLTIGADVLIARQERYSRRWIVRSGKIKKLTKRDIVLEDDLRFRHDHKRGHGHGEKFEYAYSLWTGGSFGYSLYLIDPTGAWARQITQDTAMEDARYEAMKLAETASHNLTIDKATAAIDALARWKRLAGH